jgi:hypothetical protein
MQTGFRLVRVPRAPGDELFINRLVGPSQRGTGRAGLKNYIGKYNNYHCKKR